MDYDPFGSRRARVLGALNAKDGEFKSHGGIGLLEGGEFEAAENLLVDLARYGFFVVPKGEVENWLASLSVPRTKGKWLHSIFEKMGNDPSRSDYVRPTDGDVWDFLGRIRSWSVDPNKRGIPG